MLSRVHLFIMHTSLILFIMLSSNTNAPAYETTAAIKDMASLGLAYSTHIFFHELGHQVVADDVGAEGHNMTFLTKKNGQFYFGLSTYQNIPAESKLAYAAGGDRMAGYTFEYALQSYRNHPTTFNKALMFFSGADFLIYTIIANYQNPGNDMYDPNLIRKETGCSKETLLGIIAAKTLANAYRVMNKDANFAPYIMVDRDSASFMMRFNF
ncbi:MAG: hypothetical protein JW932_18285 [Deltaproteobacteria bacterium]|nr:hypothetical protein [Deltaproteobacteria bacterium]